MSYRAGFVSFVGRPNVGKSTLTNALVGEKIAITSDKPQTTRSVIRGIKTQENGQLIFVDTPGIHRPRTLLGERLNDLVEQTLSGVDVIGMCFPAGEKLGPGDRFIHDQLSRFPRAKKVAIVTKTDEASPDQTVVQLAQVDELGGWDAVVPISSFTGDQLDVLTGVLLDLLPESAQLYPDDEVTDESYDSRVAELIRESALAGARDELPHSIAVTIDDQERPADGPFEIYASIYVERDSQKGIVIGKGGSRLKNVRLHARKSIEELLGEKVALSLQVKVLKDWQRDPKSLGRLGF
jgi:GTP-binding protein Era